MGESGSMEVRRRGVMRGWYLAEEGPREVIRAERMPRMDCLRRYSSEAASQREGSMLIIVSANSRIYNPKSKLVNKAWWYLRGAPF